MIRAYGLRWCLAACYILIRDGLVSNVYTCKNDQKFIKIVVLCFNISRIG